ncbi:hypothetical protein PAAG_05835 [Paracoccidioides lutzii Pb01]|uniref:Uncharacterized protein n=1 Tax=Paracoccidioides lutzii (strain ATCC MYA-826 / Pb01) TaxID=502779 RepID=C1H4Z4_PARBA|nr:hypothetical protein PAAG_05835 [Paracoccidioides lutzii Pb01]EEH34788.1 hypothetical protein PAAG_05835 [Paracoccidioides lutzii Pb01]
MAVASGDQLFTTSWTLHRLSPLYHGNECQTLLDNPQGLNLYANRLRDLLRGDVFRGVRVGMQGLGAVDDAVSKAGSLKSCKWDVLPTWSHWSEEESLLKDPEQESYALVPEVSAGILVTLEYENITYKSAMLTGPDGYHDTRKSVTFLPLLLTRLPNSLRQNFISFLATSFDARCSILRLPSTFLCATFENYLSILNRVTSRAHASSSRALVEKVIKETQLTLSFPPPISPSLKTLDVLISRESLSAFFVHGSNVLANTPNAPPNQTGSRGVKRAHPDSASTVDNDENPSAPFLASLSAYFNANLAMKLDISDFGKNPTVAQQKQVRLSKISCGAFVLGGEGRMKLLANPGRVIPFDDAEVTEEEDDPDSREIRSVWRANEMLLRALVLHAVGGLTQRQNDDSTGGEGS